MKDQELIEMNPWYKGYTGTIVQSENRHIVTGVYDIPEENILEITELPIGKWTRDYKTFLEEMA